MSLRDGVIKAGTVVYKKANVYKVDRGFFEGLQTFDPDNREHYIRNYDKSWVIVKLITLEDGVVPKRHRRGTERNNNWEDGFRKCRIPKAYVAEINPPLDTDEVAAGRNFLKYEVGKVVVPDIWDANPDRVCTNGIHVFFTANEAERYSV